tara:strand:- start:9692 stop:10246 length:555 start_codon:yes stop_codon:yes gene_type:complete
MIVVIQCAAKKTRNAGHLCYQNGQNVLFVAEPGSAPVSAGTKYARPDDVADTGSSWRNELIRYNEAPTNNPLGLVPAWQLYKNPAYGFLAKTYGLEKLYILSAGWGLIAADFLTPVYDITFSSSADAYKRRRNKDRYDDLCMLPSNSDEPVVFFGGKDYISLFWAMLYLTNQRGETLRVVGSGL